MGGAGRALVEEQFTWPKVAAQMKEVYEWMLGGGTRPGCLV
jgi:poly(glycerol-phosphate) alpha-glucosyltransferase